MSSDDRAADSVIVAGLSTVLMLGGFQGYDTIVAHHEFNPISFATGAAALIAAMGAGKGLRDKLSSPGSSDG